MKTKRQSRSELVAQGIKRLIVSGRLKSGDRLPTEKQMADRFGVSRVSVREATKALSFLGIIQAAPRRGLTLGKVDMGRVGQYLRFHLTLADYPKTGLLRTRLVLEAGVLPYVAQAMAQDTVIFERLEALVEASRHRDDLRHRIDHDIVFHRALLESAGIGPLLAFDDLLQIFFARFFDRPEALPTDTPWANSVAEHERLIQCLRDGDVKNARRCLVKHFDPYDRFLDE